jgi:hypothetical protein
MLQSKLDATNDKLSNDEFDGLTIEEQLDRRGWRRV